MAEDPQYIPDDVQGEGESRLRNWREGKAKELAMKLPQLLEMAKSDDFDTRQGALAALRMIKDRILTKDAAGTPEDIREEVKQQGLRVLRQAQDGMFERLAGEHGEANSAILQWATEYLNKHTVEITKSLLRQSIDMSDNVPPQKPQQQ